MNTAVRLALAMWVLVPVAAAGCTDGAGSEDPSIVVTTSILGDVVSNLVGDEADVSVLMPRGADPHEFSPSPKQVIGMREAEVVVANGAGFEVGLGDALEAAERDGATVVEAIDFVETLPVGDAEDGGATDPHFFTDPLRMAAAAEGLVEALADEIPALDTPSGRGRAAAYVSTLEAADAEVEQLLSGIPAERRKLITNHEVFGYFADRYGFEVIGVVIPGGTTLSESSARQVTALARTIAEEDVPAVFTDANSPRRLADAVAREAGGEVAVVELLSESLGAEGRPGDTYVGMVTTNARRIADALV